MVDQAMWRCMTLKRNFSKIINALAGKSNQHRENSKILLKSMKNGREKNAIEGNPRKTSDMNPVRTMMVNH